ncbi:MAG: hypothetical protein K2K72_04430 [Duncaniella sp.]|nr:hypothetical protein [Duncaniella sp.]
MTKSPVVITNGGCREGETKFFRESNKQQQLFVAILIFERKEKEDK